MIGAYLDSLSTFATVALTFLLMIALLRLARWLLEMTCSCAYHVEEFDALAHAKSRLVSPTTDAPTPPVLPAVAGGEHSGARLGDENGYLGTGLR
jgi:hypothetical protein